MVASPSSSTPQTVPVPAVGFRVLNMMSNDAETLSKSILAAFRPHLLPPTTRLRANDTFATVCAARDRFFKLLVIPSDTFGAIHPVLAATITNTFFTRILGNDGAQRLDRLIAAHNTSLPRNPPCEFSPVAQRAQAKLAQYTPGKASDHLIQCLYRGFTDFDPPWTPDSAVLHADRAQRARLAAISQVDAAATYLHAVEQPASFDPDLNPDLVWAAPAEVECVEVLHTELGKHQIRGLDPERNGRRVVAELLQQTLGLSPTELLTHIQTVSRAAWITTSFGGGLGDGVHVLVSDESMAQFQQLTPAQFHQLNACITATQSYPEAQAIMEMIHNVMGIWKTIRDGITEVDPHRTWLQPLSS